MIKTILIALALVFTSGVSYAQVKPVQDELHLLTPDQNTKLTDYLLSHKVKIVVITKPSDNIEQDALEFGRANGPDIVIWFSGKQIRVETGTRKEGDLPDMVSNEIVYSHLKLIKEKKYYDFFYKVSGDIYQKLNDPIATEKTHIPIWFWVLVVIGFIILFILCPDCAMFLLYIFLSSKNSGSSGGDFSGGGSTTSTND